MRCECDVNLVHPYRSLITISLLSMLLCFAISFPLRTSLRLCDGAIAAADFVLNIAKFLIPVA